MKELTVEIQNEIRGLVYNFFAEECEIELDEINDDTLVIDDLDGDSLMFLELVETLKKKYKLSIQMQTLGKYLLRKPAKTIAEVIELSYLIYLKENDLVFED